MSKVIGLNVEKYIGDVYQGHNLDFEVVKTPMERYHLMCVRDDGSKFIIHLENESSTCGSGWCVAQYGKLSIEEVDKLKYKCLLNNIECIITEESYTSKCSFIDNEPLQYSDNYLGKRVHRGLFKSNKGKLLNSDINGAFNIIRKVIPTFNVNSLNYGIQDIAVYPTLIKV